MIEDSSGFAGRTYDTAIYVICERSGAERSVPLNVRERVVVDNDGVS